MEKLLQALQKYLQLCAYIQAWESVLIFGLSEDSLLMGIQFVWETCASGVQ